MRKKQRPYEQKSSYKRTDTKKHNKDDGMERLNKFIAKSGLCSRRDADMLIASGLIKVNGKVVTEMGIKISSEDSVKHNNKVLFGEKHVFVLLNKPKDFITTMEDTHGRKTVMSLIGNACKERIFPVGRLDRNTTGLLLFTNDGEMTKKLTHPRYNINKIYHVQLDKGISIKELNEIRKGLYLDDGKADVDVVEYIGDGKNKKMVGIELHSGKNRIIRRIFEKLNYKVVKLDRITYAGLTKKDIPRGRWRILSQKEIGMLKMLSGK